MKTDFLTSAYIGLASKLHRVALNLLRDGDEAEDAMQESYIKLWRSSTQPESADEAHHRLVAVLRNECIDRLRRRHDFVGTDILPDSPCEPQQPDEFDRIKSELYRSLPVAQREVFDMATFGDMGYEEIALRTGQSIDAVRMNMHRARKKIRELYNQRQCR